jgi:hypothetical protein
MVPSSSIAIAADGERLTCGGFSLGEPIRLGNFEFIIDYFSSLSLSPRRGNGGCAFVGSTRSGACTPQWATMEDSTKEFLIVSSGKGSIDHPSPRWHSTGASFTPTTTTTRKENTPAMMRFPLRMTTPRTKTNHPSDRRHAQLEGQSMQARAQHPPTELGSAPWRSRLASRQITTVVEPDAPPQHEPTLEMKRILMVDFTSTQAQARSWPL